MTEVKAIPVSDLQIGAYPRTVETIRIILTKDELNERGVSVADNLIRVGELEEELAEVKKEFAAKMQPYKSENAKLLRHIKDGYYDQEVEVYQVPNFENHTIEFYSSSTGNMVGERRMTHAERSGDLFNHPKN